jgi:hypothetical protein
MSIKMAIVMGIKTRFGVARHGVNVAPAAISALNISTSVEGLQRWRGQL